MQCATSFVDWWLLRCYPQTKHVTTGDRRPSPVDGATHGAVQRQASAEGAIASPCRLRCYNAHPFCFPKRLCRDYVAVFVMPSADESGRRGCMDFALFDATRAARRCARLLRRVTSAMWTWPFNPLANPTSSQSHTDGLAGGEGRVSYGRPRGRDVQGWAEGGGHARRQHSSAFNPSRRGEQYTKIYSWSTGI